MWWFPWSGALHLLFCACQKVAPHGHKELWVWRHWVDLTRSKISSALGSTDAGNWGIASGIFPFIEIVFSLCMKIIISSGICHSLTIHVSFASGSSKLSKTRLFSLFQVTCQGYAGECTPLTLTFTLFLRDQVVSLRSIGGHGAWSLMLRTDSVCHGIHEHRGLSIFCDMHVGEAMRLSPKVNL